MPRERLPASTALNSFRMLPGFLDVRPWLRTYLQLKGYYLLPAWAGILVAARYAVSRVRAPIPGVRRGLLAGLALTAVFSGLVYVNFFNFIYGGFLNPYEFFHYYLGSKYAAEVGYFDLYNAAVVADREDRPMLEPDRTQVCDLRTYGYRPLRDVLAEAPRYRALFSEARWREWVADVTYFKDRLGPKLFDDLVRDHGYNATPVWTALVGGALSRRVPTSSPAGMLTLALLDVVLLAGAVAGIAWAYGSWPALLTVVLVASSYLMAHVHMKGAFLRTDFAVVLVLAMCLIARGRPALAGALAGYASLARIFPAVFLLGPGVLLVRDLLPSVRREVRRPGLAFRIAIHAAAAAAVLETGWLVLGGGLREVVTERIAPWSVLFPAGLVPATLAALVLTLGIRETRRGQLDPSHGRFFAGFGMAVAVLVLASLVHDGGSGAWESFARKIALHRETYSHWNVGVASLVVGRFDPAGPRQAALAARPPGTETWRGNLYFRQEDVRRDRPAILLLQILGVALAAWAAWRLEAPRAFALGFVPTFFLTAPTYYYYIVLLLPFLYFATDLDRLRGTLGTMYLFLFAALGFAFYFRWDQYFVTYYWNSALALGLAAAMVAAARAPEPAVTSLRGRGAPPSARRWAASAPASTRTSPGRSRGLRSW